MVPSWTLPANLYQDEALQRYNCQPKCSTRSSGGTTSSLATHKTPKNAGCCNPTLAHSDFGSPTDSCGVGDVSIVLYIDQPRPPDATASFNGNRAVKSRTVAKLSYATGLSAIDETTDRSVLSESGMR